MQISATINFHLSMEKEPLQAEASSSGKTNWLSIKFRGRELTAFFLPEDVAKGYGEALAKAINEVGETFFEEQASEMESFPHDADGISA